MTVMGAADLWPECDVCGRPTNPEARGTLHSVSGWVEQRRGGGVHHVRFRRATGKVMCSGCALTIRDTGNAAQGSLL